MHIRCGLQIAPVRVWIFPMQPQHIGQYYTSGHNHNKLYHIVPVGAATTYRTGWHWRCRAMQRLHRAGTYITLNYFAARDSSNTQREHILISWNLHACTVQAMYLCKPKANQGQGHSVVRDATQKKTGFFGNFSQMSDPPPFGNPCFQKKKYGLFCILGP